ncbi:PREDICTED: chymotrypsin-2-like [Ceratosolen solmsi marchali]|uniref:Chymotrypsin-2-like n=1 Tax=Ceratosolen solmsi marchali TaxID=326594 RepID=A0AAJ6YQ23_9HYME|nr:PREDICTED: chymotrypsin-2-like [Ceratosolen solmsi marchali]
MEPAKRLPSSHLYTSIEVVLEVKEQFEELHKAFHKEHNYLELKWPTTLRHRLNESTRTTTKAEEISPIRGQSREVACLHNVPVLPFSGVFCIRQRIAGGENADIENFPHLVSLRYSRNNKHFCGGTIISQHHILTVAHCMEMASHNNILIYSGSSSSINEMIQFNALQQKINLPTVDVVNGAIAMVAGWGVMFHKSNIMSDQLQKAWMVVLDSTTCQEAIPFVHKEQICAYQNVGVGACTGDSGSPLVSNNVAIGLASYAIECAKGLPDGDSGGPVVANEKLIGIQSWVIPCAQGYPDVFTNVYSYLDFINSNIQNFLL